MYEFNYGGQIKSVCGRKKDTSVETINPLISDCSKLA